MGRSEVGRCALCQKERKLLNSHLLPAALYRLVQPSNSSAHPVHVSGGKAIMTSRQFTCPLLCKDCEDRFSKKGECIVIAECYRPQDSFFLRSLLETEVPSFSYKDERWFAGSNLMSVDVNAYRYFAVSVFWRGSVGRWKPGASLPCERSLGSRYEDVFGLYLLSKAPLPKQALLIVFVDSGEDPLAVISLPEPSNAGGYHIHHLFIPGIEFRMFLGKHIAPWLRRLSDRFDTNVFFVLTDFRRRPRYDELVRTIKRAQPKGRLSREWTT